MARDLASVTAADALVERLVDLVEGAEAELAVTLPPGLFETVREPLARAVDDGALVLVLATGRDPVDGDALAGRATLGRRWSGAAAVTCVADGERGLYAPAPFVAEGRTDPPATAFKDRALVAAQFDAFVGTYWRSGTEVHAAEPAPLGRTYDSFRHALVQATLRLRESEPLRAVVEAHPTDGRDPERVTGDVLDAHQRLVDPVSGALPPAISLVLRADDGRVEVGGSDAVGADLVAGRVTLERT